MGAGAVIPACRATARHDAVGEGEVAMHLAYAGYVGLVRLPDGRLDIAAALDAAEAKAAGGPTRAIANVLEACAVADAAALLAEEAIFGAGLLTRRRPRSAVPGLIIAGDAAGYVEPFTGEGIAWALVQGEHAGALGACAAHDSHAWSSLPRDWSRWLASAIDPRRLPCRALRWTIRRPAARRCATAALSRSSLARATAAAFMRRTWRPYSTATAPEAFPCAS
jgi:flavin-dependent dehydrogenase